MGSERKRWQQMCYFITADTRDSWDIDMKWQWLFSLASKKENDGWEEK